ncbi:MAG: aminotransferase class IV [Pyrinomonadaceae bacterium]
MAENCLLYGKGIFTTVRISRRTVLFWDSHWKRLEIASEKIGLDLSLFTREWVTLRLQETIENEKIVNGGARITFLDGRPSKLWPTVGTRTEPTKILIEAKEGRTSVTELKFTRSSFLTNSRSPISGLKTCNYLEPIMSLDEAKVRGFHEAIRVNERGFVTSACMANVFWLKGGELFTPGLATGCLAGTTREFVLENIDCREVEVGVEALDDAEAIFLTSAGIGVVQVAEFDGRRLEKVDHPILHLLPY